MLTDIPVTFCGKSVTDPLVLVYPLAFLGKAMNRHVDGIVDIQILP